MNRGALKSTSLQFRFLYDGKCVSVFKLLVAISDLYSEVRSRMQKLFPRAWAWAERDRCKLKIQKCNWNRGTTSDPQEGIQRNTQWRLFMCSLTKTFQRHSRPMKIRFSFHRITLSSQRRSVIPNMLTAPMSCMRWLSEAHGSRLKTWELTATIKTFLWSWAEVVRESCSAIRNRVPSGSFGSVWTKTWSARK